ncbi:MAG: four helix bundle protein [Flavobacteriales bacterium]
MSEEKNYKNLDVWKEARKLVSIIYTLTNEFPEDEKFGLTSQIKRAAISVPSNIAEGMGRNSNKETRQFFFIAKGSLYEIETQLYLAIDLGFIKEDKSKHIFNQITSVRKLIIGFIKYLDK